MSNDKVQSIMALKPCPFCGNETPEFERMGTPRQSCIVICGHCGARHESSDEGEFNGTSWNERAAIRAIAAPGVAQGWHAAVQKEAEDSDLPEEVIEGIFRELLPSFLADKEEAGYITLPLDKLIQEDSYGVYGSEFYRCRICNNESGAGVLNKGIEHEHDCPLAAPSPTAEQRPPYCGSGHCSCIECPYAAPPTEHEVKP